MQSQSASSIADARAPIRAQIDSEAANPSRVSLVRDWIRPIRSEGRHQRSTELQAHFLSYRPRFATVTYSCSGCSCTLTEDSLVFSLRYDPLVLILRSHCRHGQLSVGGGRAGTVRYG